VGVAVGVAVWLATRSPSGTRGGGAMTSSGEAIVPPAERAEVRGGRWVETRGWTGVEQFDEVLLPELDRALGQDADRDEDAGRTPDASEIAAFVSGWIHARWGQESFEFYDAFMREQGYELISPASSMSEGIVASANAWQPESAQPLSRFEDAVRAVWLGNPALDNARSLRGVMVDSNGIRAAYGRTCAGDFFRWPIIRAGSVPEEWQGGNVATFGLVFAAPGVSWQELYSGGKCFSSATVGIMMRFEGGTVVPVLLWFWYQPETRRWWLAQVGTSHTPEGFGGIAF
jgi:hypothetical protein